MRLRGFGQWPISLVGMPGDPVSNMAPPTVVLAIHCVNWVLLVALLRSPLTRLLERENVWRRVTWMNIVAMTLYLWHLPMLVVLVVLSHFFGISLWAIIRLMWPLEHFHLPWWDWPFKALIPQESWASKASALGVLEAGMGPLMLSATGLGGFPFRIMYYVNLPLNSALAILLLFLSGTLIRWAGAPRTG